MKYIPDYFPFLTEKQLELFEKYIISFTKKNEIINLVSRKDIENLEINHILYSLAISKITQFKNGTSFLDVGTGGGLPGIPLAIMFPDCEFILIDSIGKKAKATQEIIDEIGIKNASAKQVFSSELKEKFDFVLARGVTAFPAFVKMVSHCIKPKGINTLPNGILYLKGGEFQEEISEFKKIVNLYQIKDYFKEDFFETKKIIYLPF